MFTRFLVTGLPLPILVRHGGVCATGTPSTRLCYVQSPLNLPQQQPKLTVSLLSSFTFHLGMEPEIYNDVTTGTCCFLSNSVCLSFFIFIFAESCDASTGKGTVRRTTFPKEVEVLFFTFLVDV